MRLSTASQNSVNSGLRSIPSGGVILRLNTPGIRPHHALPGWAPRKPLFTYFRGAVLSYAFSIVLAFSSSLLPNIGWAESKVPKLPKIEFERYRLDNGLEIILHQDNRVPLVAVNVWFHVASGDETPGKSGFAHLFEHMLFQGSKHVGADRHFDILKGIGATDVNGTTSSDRTNYFEVVPSHFLETALWLESDRMGYMLPLLTQESLNNQIEVVRNERRQRYDNVPYGRNLLAASELLYPEGHPYRYMTIGKHEDLANATLEDVVGFYKYWYGPANATLTLAGDFDKNEAKALIQKWFGTFPKTSRPDHVKPKTPTIKHRRIVLPDEFAELERVDYAWHTPEFLSDGDAAFDILAFVLGDSGTGRLYKRLVHETQLAQEVSVWQWSKEFSSLFNVQVTAKSTADLRAIEDIINEEIHKIREQPISQVEFDRAVANIESGYTWNLESLMERADVLQRYNHYWRHPAGIERDLQRYRNNNPGTVLQNAKRFLASDVRVEVITAPRAKPAAAASSPGPSHDQKKSRDSSTKGGQ